jgi:hypothetical protein
MSTKVPLAFQFIACAQLVEVRVSGRVYEAMMLIGDCFRASWGSLTPGLQRKLRSEFMEIGKILNAA